MGLTHIRSLKQTAENLGSRVISSDLHVERNSTGDAYLFTQRRFRMNSTNRRHFIRATLSASIAAAVLDLKILLCPEDETQMAVNSDGS